MGWCPAPEYSEALEAYDSYYVIVSLPQWTKGYSLESSFITQVGFKFSSNMKVIIMTKFILSMMAKSSHSLYMVINRESDPLWQKARPDRILEWRTIWTTAYWLPGYSVQQWDVNVWMMVKFNVSQDTSRHQLLSSVNLSSQYFSYCLPIPTDLFGVWYWTKVFINQKLGFPIYKMGLIFLNSVVKLYNIKMI